MLSDIGSSKGTRVGAADAKKVRSALLLPGQSIWLGGNVIEIVYELASGAGKGGSPTLLKKPLRLFHSTIRRSSRSSSAASPDGPRRGLFSLGRRLSHQKFVDEADAADVSLGGV